MLKLQQNPCAEIKLDRKWLLLLVSRSVPRRKSSSFVFLASSTSVFEAHNLRQHVGAEEMGEKKQNAVKEAKGRSVDESCLFVLLQQFTEICDSYESSRSVD